MHAEDEHSGVVEEDARVAVALVDVEVDDGDAPGEVFALKVARGHGDVVKDAVAFAAVGVGVVGAAGKITGDGITERCLGGLERSAHGGAASLVEARATGEADALERLELDRAVAHGLDVVARVGEAEELLARQWTGLQFVDVDDLLMNEKVAQHPVLCHREAVSFRQGKRVVVGVENIHGASIDRDAGIGAREHSVGGAARVYFLVSGSDDSCDHSTSSIAYS